MPITFSTSNSRFRLAAEMARFTDKTIDSPALLHRELEQVRQQGYALDDEEHAVGLRCVAAPIYDQNEQALAAISLSGPKARMVDERLAELGSAIQFLNSAHDISPDTPVTVDAYVDRHM